MESQQEVWKAESELKQGKCARLMISWGKQLRNNAQKFNLYSTLPALTTFLLDQAGMQMKRWFSKYSIPVVIAIRCSGKVEITFFL